MDKMQESHDQIRIWQSSPPDVKDKALNNLITVLEKDPNGYYLTTTKGYPEINQLIVVSEEYCRDILKNQLIWFVIMPNSTGAVYSMEVQQLKNDLAAVSGYTVTETRIRKVADYFQNYPSLGNEIFEMLRNEGYNDIGYFFCNLPLDRIKANGYNTGKMNAEIAFKNQTTDIGSIVASTFVKGQVYSKQEVKGILQDIYNRLGLKKTAKATDLSNYIVWKDAKKNGLKAMRIL